MWKRAIRNFANAEIFISNLPLRFKPHLLKNIVPADSTYKMSKTYCFVTVPEGTNPVDIAMKINGFVIGDNTLRAKVNGITPGAPAALEKKKINKKAPKHPLIEGFVETYHIRKDFLFM